MFYETICIQLIFDDVKRHSGVVTLDIVRGTKYEHLAKAARDRHVAQRTRQFNPIRQRPHNTTAASDGRCCSSWCLFSSCNKACNQRVKWSAYVRLAFGRTCSCMPRPYLPVRMRQSIVCRDAPTQCRKSRHRRRVATA